MVSEASRRKSRHCATGCHHRRRGWRGMPKHAHMRSRATAALRSRKKQKLNPAIESWSQRFASEKDSTTFTGFIRFIPLFSFAFCCPQETESAGHGGAKAKASSSTSSSATASKDPSATGGGTCLAKAAGLLGLDADALTRKVAVRPVMSCCFDALAIRGVGVYRRL